MGEACPSPSVYRSQRQLDLMHSFLPALPEFPGSKLRLQACAEKCLFLQNQLTPRPPHTELMLDMKNIHLPTISDEKCVTENANDPKTKEC